MTVEVDPLLSEAWFLLEDDPTLGRSALHKHMVRAVYLSLRKGGEAGANAAKGAFKITNSSLQKNGYQGAGDSGRMTGKGANRSRRHASEPAAGSKAADYANVSKLAGAK